GIIELRFVLPRVEDERHRDRLDQSVYLRSLDAKYSGCKVEFPSDEHQRVALAHQVSVAELLRRGRIPRRSRSVELVEEQHVAAGDDLEQPHPDRKSTRR